MEDYEDYGNEDSYEDDEMDEDELAHQNCGQHVEDGVIYCQLIGTEYCDWDCPFVDDIGKTLDELKDELEIEGEEGGA